MATIGSPGGTPSPGRDDGDFDALVAGVRAHFDGVVAAHGPRLFAVDAGDLDAAWLEALPVEVRPEHRCATCAAFLRQYGHLVAITEAGALVPAMWPASGVPDLYAPAVAVLRRGVTAAPITGMFLSGATEWGHATKGGWPHLSVTPAAPAFANPVASSAQVMAEKREHFATLSRALAEYPPALVARALTVLDADALYRAEKVAGPARFLHRVHLSQKAAKGAGAKRNVVWRAVAGAPPGFCTPRSSMVGTLLDDMAVGLPFDTVKAKFAAKMHPSQYMRPQRDADAGNIAQAEATVAKLGLEPALRRRFARVDEVQAVWRPAGEAPPSKQDGVFAHLKRAVTPTPVPDASTVAISWTKFERRVLPDALGMELYVAGQMNFGAMTTASDPDAPPILQWDRDDARNPFASYVYVSGTTPGRWGLDERGWVRVTAIALQPWQWADRAEQGHFGVGALLLLDGARDLQIGELALFPEYLRSELHGVRRTIEQFSKSRVLEGAEEGTACGLMLGSENAPHALRVRSSTGVVSYHIDRWE